MQNQKKLSNSLNTTLPEYLVKYTKYKWEYLRRNPEYIKDWNDLKDYTEELVEKGRYPMDGRMTKMEIKYAFKWKIACLMPPENSFDDYLVRYSDLNENEQEDEDYLNAPGESITVWNIGFDSCGFLYDRLHPDILQEMPVIEKDAWVYDPDWNPGGIIHGQYLKDEIAQTGKLSVDHS